MKKFMIMSLLAATAAVGAIGQADAAHNSLIDLALRIIPALAS
jgi:hypothetical protein